MFVITSSSSNSPAIRLNSFLAIESNHVGGFTLSFLLVTVFRLLIAAQFHLLSIDLYYLLINANESVSLSFLCEPPPSAEPLLWNKTNFLHGKLGGGLQEVAFCFFIVGDAYDFFFRIIFCFSSHLLLFSCYGKHGKAFVN